MYIICLFLITLTNALSNYESKKIACALEALIVEEPIAKSYLIEALSNWDRKNSFAVVVINGYFATGKTFIASILSKLLAENNQEPPLIFDASDAERSEEQFQEKVGGILDGSIHKANAGGKKGTILFDDVPCWKDISRIKKTIERCYQFPEQCRGVLILITTNDGWCGHDYCNYNEELDNLVDQYVPGGTLNDFDPEECSEIRCGIGMKLTPEECTFRGCCCKEVRDGFCRISACSTKQMYNILTNLKHWQLNEVQNIYSID